MPLKIKETQTVEASASEMRRLRHEYQQEFMGYCGAPPDFEEWAIARLHRERDALKDAQ